MPYRTEGHGIYTSNSSGGDYTHGTPVIEKNVAGIPVKQEGVSFDSPIADQDVIESSEDFYLQTSGVVEIAGAFSHGAALYVNSTTGVVSSDNLSDEVQTIAFTATGGTFTLTYSGQTTSAIAYNASAAVVQSALEALSNIDVAEAIVTKQSQGNYTVSFAGTLADTNVAALTGNGASLTGGSTTVTIATTTGGGAATGVILGTVVETSSQGRGVRSGYSRVDLGLKP